MKSINLTPLVAKFTIVKHNYDTKQSIEARIESKVHELQEILKVDQPFIKHNLLYSKRENSKRYVISVYDYSTFIVDTKKCFAQFDSKLSLDDLLK